MLEIVIPPEQGGGVYDFARLLASGYGEESVKLEHLSRGDVHRWQIDPDATVYLQMIGRGFQRRGAPLWLLREIRKRRSRIKRLGVFFHELYAFGPPWSSTFWLSPVQRHIARGLAELSDFWVTNRDGSKRWLERFAGNKPHAVLPVFSTIGEPAALPPVKRPMLVVFGKPGLRRLTYLAAGRKLFDWCHGQSLTIHDIGAPITDRRLQRLLSDNGIVQHGQTNAAEISHLLGEARYALLAYPVEYVAKSTVFAAACAHGVCPVLITPTATESDGLVKGRHYHHGFPADPVTEDSAESIGVAARKWYSAHGLSHHVALLRNMAGETS